MSTSIVILTKNSSRTIKQCLQSCLSSNYAPLEIIIVDGGSVDNTLTLVKETLEKFPHKILYDEGKGLGYARDIGWRTSNGKYILMLDSDVILPSNFIEEAIKIMEYDNKVGSLGAKVKHVCKEKGWIPIFLEKNLAIHLHWKESTYPNEITATPTTCTLFRRKALEEINGFDHYLKFGAEDLDISFKLRKAGYKIAFLNIYAYHLETSRRFWKINFKYGRSYVHIAKKHPKQASLLTKKKVFLTLALIILPLQIVVYLIYLFKYSKLGDLLLSEKIILPFIETIRQALRTAGMIYELYYLYFKKFHKFL
jgi:GT2 family glycosyltransferase